MTVKVTNDIPDRGVAANLLDQVNKLQADLAQCRTQLAAAIADLVAFRTTFNAHVHSGITAGGANSAVSTTTAAALTSATPAALTSDQLVAVPTSKLT